MRWSSFPSRSCARSLSRVRWTCSRRCASVAGAGVGGHRRRRQKQIEQALFGGLLGALGDFVELFFADHVDGGFHQIADHGFDVAADVADFGVFRSFDFHERAAGEPREAAGDLRLADAGGPDHQNIFRKNFLGQLRLKLLAANAIAQGDGDGFLRCVLPDDVFVQLDDDFARRQLVERRKRLGLGRLLVLRTDRSPCLSPTSPLIVLRC